MWPREPPGDADVQQACARAFRHCELSSIKKPRDGQTERSSERVTEKIHVSHYWLYDGSDTFFINTEKSSTEMEPFTFIENKWTVRETEINLFHMLRSTPRYDFLHVAVIV